MLGMATITLGIGPHSSFCFSPWREQFAPIKTKFGKGIKIIVLLSSTKFHFDRYRNVYIARAYVGYVRYF